MILFIIGFILGVVAGYKLRDKVDIKIKK